LEVTAASEDPAGTKETFSEASWHAEDASPSFDEGLMTGCWAGATGALGMADCVIL
jgi:hypothetical protein